MTSRYRVVIVDDQNISRSFFELYVQAATNYELAAGLRTAQDAVSYVDTHPVDLLILDVLMKYGIDGLTAARQIKQTHPGIRIILTTSTSETSWEEQAKQAGVESFWYKEYDERSLIEIMDRTMKGESVYPSDPPEVEFGMASRSQLTDRELEVLRELTGSLTNEEIGEKLHMAPATVKRHLKNIMEKTGFRNRIELAMNARSLGLVVSESERTGCGGPG